MPHTVTNLLVHFIFSTKQRRPLISPDLESDLHAYLGGIVRQIDGIALTAAPKTRADDLADPPRLFRVEPPIFPISRQPHDFHPDIKSSSMSHSSVLECYP
jgi:hypothetical protein